MSCFVFNAVQSCNKPPPPPFPLFVRVLLINFTLDRFIEYLCIHMHLVSTHTYLISKRSGENAGDMAPPWWLSGERVGLMTWWL